MNTLPAAQTNQLPSKQITVIESQAIDKLIPAYRDIVSMKYTSPVVRSLGPEEAKKFLKNVATATLVKMGNYNEAADAKIIVILADSIWNLCYKKYHNITLMEVSTAIEKGAIHGEYGPYMGLNEKSINQFFSGYTKDQIRIAAIGKFNEELDKINLAMKEKVYSPDEKAAMIKSGFLNCYKDWKAKKEIGFDGPVYYEILKQNKVIVPNKDLGNICQERAIEIIRKSYLAKRINKQIKLTDFEKVMTAGLENDAAFKRTFRIEILKYWFELTPEAKILSTLENLNYYEKEEKENP